jgi:hypothetical protein
MAKNGSDDVNSLPEDIRAELERLFAEFCREHAFGISPNHSAVEIKPPESRALPLEGQVQTNWLPREALGSQVGERPNRERAQDGGLALLSPIPASTSSLSHSSAIEEIPTCFCKQQCECAPRSYRHFEEQYIETETPCMNPSPYTNDLDLGDFLNEYILPDFLIS